MATVPFARRTSVYMMTIDSADPDQTADWMVLGVPTGTTVTGSGTRPGQGFVRFRVAGDEAALAVAREIAAGSPFELITDYGVNARVVAQN